MLRAAGRRPHEVLLPTRSRQPVGITPRPTSQPTSPIILTSFRNGLSVKRHASSFAPIVVLQSPGPSTPEQTYSREPWNRSADLNGQPAHKSGYFGPSGGPESGFDRFSAALHSAPDLGPTSGQPADFPVTISEYPNGTFWD